MVAPGQARRDSASGIGATPVAKPPFASLRRREVIQRLRSEGDRREPRQRVGRLIAINHPRRRDGSTSEGRRAASSVPLRRACTNNATKSSPPGLMRGAAAASGVAVEILVKQRIILKIRSTLRAAAGRAPDDGRSRRAGTADIADGPARWRFRRDSGDSRPGRVFDTVIVTVILMKAIKRLDQQEIDRHPDRAAPVGIPAKYARCRTPQAHSTMIRFAIFVGSSNGFFS